MNTICLFRGHADDLRVGPGHLTTACRRCGRTTAGVEIGPLRVGEALPGKGRPHARAKALQRAWIAWQLVEREG